MPAYPLDLEQLEQALPLHDSGASREIETIWQSRLPSHTLMSRAGEAIYRLSAALAPHAQHVWIACGSGNNGGDGLVAAMHWIRRLRSTGGCLTVTWLGQEHGLPPDAAYAFHQAQAAGVAFSAHPPESFDLAIDAILGLGLNESVRGPANDWIERLQKADCPVLCVDLPSGLHADDGRWLSPCDCQPSTQRHTLQLLTLKPGTFTAMGRTASGHVWFDDLGTGAESSETRATAWLYGWSHTPPSDRSLAHHHHKGNRGDVLILGGSTDPAGLSMAGAALLAARASLKAGAGRVYAGLLHPGESRPPLQVDPCAPELMFRDPHDAIHAPWFSQAVCVCGCGAGTMIQPLLAHILAHSPALVLDADALNAIAADAGLQDAVRKRADQGQTTVITPHPKEAARLLGQTVEAVQAHRLRSAQSLADHLACVVVLKGSGTVVASVDAPLLINPTGNGLLATAGTGDVLAGMVGAYLAAKTMPAREAAALAVYRHGQLANHWAMHHHTLTAHDLIDGL